MVKVANVTYHAAYNYGSVLQAYALQKFILNNFNVEYKIINLRLPVQKNIYKTFFEKKDGKSFIKSIIYFNKRRELFNKNKKFEDFINSKLSLTSEIKNQDDIDKIEKFDYYISGSDQIWNITLPDFSWLYFLEKIKGKKISYSASLGSDIQKHSSLDLDRIKNDLNDYSYLSVRDKKSKDFINSITKKDVFVNVDPTMLLSKEEWFSILDEKPLISGKYILLYNLKNDKNMYEIAKFFSKKLNMPVIITLPAFKIELFYPLKRYFDVGPLEFLNLIKNAELVLSSSFHGTVFSILFDKPFFALNGDSDNRLKTLLSQTHLEERSINISNFKDKISTTFNLDFTNKNKFLDEERVLSREFLGRALEMSGDSDDM